MENKEIKIVKKGNDFVTYDYITIEVDNTKISLYVDTYENLGWELTNTVSRLFNTELAFKRNRKVTNKKELLKLQRNIEESLYNIARLENSKINKVMISALVLGIPASLVMGGGMALIMTQPDNVKAFIVGLALGVVGLVTCIFNPIIYNKKVARNIRRVNPLIEEEYDKIASVAEQVQELL